MIQTKEIKCPKCKTIQTEDIEDLIIDTGYMEGNFQHVCENCNDEFTVEFEYRPFIRTIQ
ncbi:hypothetical protein [Lysinibacillus fusiformis]|uniref:hypothetical protein n=1 Tax=Lysinibacillus fusiformis TaxID=28031 RepID=UPI0018829917|nr:hypothetical protein [Lysinibacillus fusiformis]MBD8523718.1 hypothetical protein [Lysinibacillus fusiformis]